MVYKNVYFRLDRNGYCGSSGWTEAVYSDKFFSEIVGLFQADGWECISGEHGSGRCPEVKKGYAEIVPPPASCLRCRHSRGYPAY